VVATEHGALRALKGVEVGAQSEIETGRKPEGVGVEAERKVMLAVENTPAEVRVRRRAAEQGQW
jgi:hypothetical protein